MIPIKVREFKMTTLATKPPKLQAVKPLTSLKAWKSLKTHAKEIAKVTLRELFAADPNRGEELAFEAVGLFFDYSKNRITNQTIKLLFELAEEAGLRERMDAMFRGDKINFTEQRAVLH